jgi:predicted protein tyrosine phosphatase
MDARMSVVMDELNLNWITPALAIGGCFPISAARRLAGEHGVTRVVDLRAESCDDAGALGRHGIALLHLPTADHCAIARDSLREGISWVTRALDAGHRVLVHCQHGIGRSALLAVCVMMAGGTAPLRALTRAKRARGVVSPSPDQLRALMAFARELRRDGAVPWSVPSFDALATVAYRHLRATAAP